MKNILYPLTALGILVLCSASALAQGDAPQWKPHVGDSFLYQLTSHEVQYWHGAVDLSTGRTDTLRMEVVSTDTSILQEQHLVALQVTHLSNSTTPTTEFFAVRETASGKSNHAFSIERVDNRSDRDDFTDAPDSVVDFLGDTLHGFVSRFDSTIVQGVTGHRSRAAVYSPRLHWFYSVTHYSNEPTPDYTYTGTSDTLLLLSATMAAAGVRTITEVNLSVAFDPHTRTIRAIAPASADVLTLQLIDLTGRTLRSFAVPASDLDQRIPIDAASLPDGIYFVRGVTGSKEQICRVAVVE